MNTRTLFSLDSALGQPSLFGRARLSLLLLALLVGVPFAFAAVLLVKQLSAEQTEQMLSERAPLAAQLLESNLSNKLETLVRSTANLQIEHIEDFNQAALAELLLDFDAISWAGIADSTGQLITSHPQEARDADAGWRPWFQKGLNGPVVIDRTEASFLVQHFPEKEHPHQFIDMAAPIRNSQGASIGVVALHFDWEAYQRGFSRMFSGRVQDKQVSYLVVGAEGQIRLASVSEQHPELELAYAQNAPVTPALLERFHIATFNGNQDDLLEQLGWTVYVLKDQTSSNQVTASVGLVGLIGFLVGLLGAAAVFVWSTRNISKVTAEFVEALSQEDKDKLNELRPKLPREIVPLSKKAEALISEMRNKQLSLVVALDKARGSYMEVSRMIDQAPLAIAMFNNKMNYIACSEVWQTRFIPDGVRPIGQSYYELYPQATEQWRAAHTEALSGKIIKQENDVWTDLTGNQCWVDWTIQPWLQLDETVGGIIIIILDVTEEHLSKVALAKREEQFKLAMEGSHDGLWDWNIQTDEFYFSPRWKGMLGYEDHEIGASTEVWQSLLHPDDSERAQASLRDCLVNRETTNFLETFRLAHKDGHWVTVLSRAKIIRDSQGMAIRMVGTHLDRTEVEALEGALSEAWIKAEAETQSNEAKSKFLAAVSHEIRNPLNSIAGFARLIRDEVDNPELENYAQLLLQTTGSLNLILNDLLDFAKIEAGRFELSMGQFNLQSTVDELAQGARVLCDDKQIGFKLESALIPANLYIGDVVRVRQIIQNLLSNAIKFTHKGGVLLKLSISPSDGDFDCVTVEVGDTGIGMSEDKLRDLFKPFSQVHAADGNVYGGTGLGLSIVKSLVELMGGQVSCESEAGKGSTFLVKFKLKRSDELYKPVGTAQDLEVKIKRRVLIADDAPSNLKILQTFLVKCGHFVCAASDGREALKLLGEHEFDVVLLDMDMPGKTGLEVVREVKESGSLNSRAKFACLSGHAAESMSDSALEGGFEQFFTKPFNLDDVLSFVNQEI